MALCALAVGCAATGLPPRSSEANPLGWPSMGLSAAGRAGEDSGVPLVRECGSLLSAVGDLLETPALAVEGREAAAARMAVQGPGETLTAAFNLPFFASAGDVDLGRDAPRLNAALAWIEAKRPIFPKGTRVRASGKDLLWQFPGEGEAVQRAEVGLSFGVIAPREYLAQERSWGFVVRSAADWNGRDERQRAVTIVHEFYHQHLQMRNRFLGWSSLYWPAYFFSYVTQGYDSHWAEYGPHGAASVERALSDWVPRGE